MSWLIFKSLESKRIKQETKTYQHTEAAYMAAYCCTDFAHAKDRGDLSTCPGVGGSEKQAPHGWQHTQNSTTNATDASSGVYNFALRRCNTSKFFR